MDIIKKQNSSCVCSFRIMMSIIWR